MYLIKYARQPALDMYGLVWAYKIDENMYANLSDTSGTERTIDSSFFCMDSQNTLVAARYTAWYIVAHAATFHVLTALMKCQLAHCAV